MIFTSVKGLFQEKFLEKEIKSMDFLKFVRYYYPQKNPKFGYCKRDKYTKIIDLMQSEEDIYKNFKKNTKNEINKAKRENIVFKIEKNLDIFFEYYNKFARSKHYEELAYSTLEKYKKHMLIVKAMKENDILTMYVYIYEHGHVILLYSASLFRDNQYNNYKNLVGYANRFLHYESMLYFKNIGFSVYDFGGYAKDTKDFKLEGINRFKDSFGGEVLHAYIYTSYTLCIFVMIKKIVSLFGLKTKKL